MYTLKIWNHPTNADEVRIYLGGTTRQSIYLKRRAKDGKVVWSSKANDTPHKFQTGDHYGKVRKDGEAARDVAEAFAIKLGDEGDEGEWERALQIARDGIQVEG